MNRFFYTLLIRLLSPALLAWMAVRARRSGGDWEVFSGSRFGRYDRPAPLDSPIWVHAVSLGESRAAHPFVRALLNRGESVLLTHFTVTGRAEGERAFAAEIAQGRLVQAWQPYDFPGCTDRFIAHFKPQVGVLIEREVWPNLIASARRAGVPMMLVSARLSDQALRQSLRAGSVMRVAFESFDAVYAQTLSDAQRLEQAGAQAVRVSGSFKFDISLPVEVVAGGRAFARELGGRKVVVIASTREGEDELFVRAIGRQVKSARAKGGRLASRVLFCLVPRHPQRFDEAAALLARSGLPFVRRSRFIAQAGADGATGHGVGRAGTADLSTAQACGDALVLLGDTLGEMPWYYGAGNVAIVAGSFEPLGGQNLIEACAVGVPVVVGPHTRNFEKAVVDAIDEGAAIRVQSADAAIQFALRLLDEPERMAQMSRSGLHWVQNHTGAVARVIAGLNKLKPSAVRPQP